MKSKPRFRVGQVVMAIKSERFLKIRLILRDISYRYLDENEYIYRQAELRPLTKRETGKR